MSNKAANQAALADRSERLRVEQLLACYPELSLEEEAYVLRFLKRGPPAELGLLAANEAIEPQLARFREHHRRAFSIGPAGLLAALAIVAAVVLAVLVLWESGSAR